MKLGLLLLVACVWPSFLRAAPLLSCDEPALRIFHRKNYNVVGSLLEFYRNKENAVTNQVYFRVFGQLTHNYESPEESKDMELVPGNGSFDRFPRRIVRSKFRF